MHIHGLGARSRMSNQFMTVCISAYPVVKKTLRRESERKAGRNHRVYISKGGSQGKKGFKTTLTTNGMVDTLKKGYSFDYWQEKEMVGENNFGADARHRL